MPTRILVMRHAEKPEDPEDPDLTPDGRKRAKALAAFIPDHFGKPDFIFAAASSEHSKRSRETIKPLSEAVGVPIDTDYADQDYGALAKILREQPKFKDKLIVVCWHHSNIPNLLHALEVADGAYPDPWKREIFNLILQVDMAEDSAPAVTRIAEPF